MACEPRFRSYHRRTVLRGIRLLYNQEKQKSHLQRLLNKMNK